MSLTPTGAPAWVRTNSAAHYGGNENKRNYLSQGVVDPLTDVSAEQWLRMAADMAAVARVAPFATMHILCNDTAPAAPTILACRMMTGVRSASYAGDAAPTGFPGAARVSDGVVTVTFASAYTDAYGVTGAFSLTNGIIVASCATSSNYGHAPYEILSATQLRIVVRDTADAPIDDAKISLVVYGGG